jgi:hypothetical protein
MSKVTGTVEDVYSFDSKVGKLYGIMVDGEKYGTYKTKPDCSAGDTVSFRFKVSGDYNNIDTKTLEITAGVPTAGLAKPSGGAFKDKQEVISRQSALNSALAFVQILVDADAVPGVAKATKSDDKFSILRGIVAETAEEFYTASMAGVAPGGEIPDAGESETSVAMAKAAADSNWR